MVFPVRGPSLGCCLREMSLAARMSAAKQLLIALKGLHAAGIVHRGKSTPAFVFLTLYAKILYRLEQRKRYVGHGSPR